MSNEFIKITTANVITCVKPWQLAGTLEALYAVGETDATIELNLPAYFHQEFPAETL